ncbi:MAG: DeoR family transcriptional regulator, partial [Hydrogenophaga sp.]
MNLNPRHTELLDEVRAHGPQTIEALAERFGVTLQTVRRDVQRLAEAGFL